MIEVSLSALMYWGEAVSLSVATALMVVGIYILNRRDLELGALIGVYPLIAGVLIWFIAGMFWLVYFLMHVRFVP